MKLRLVRIAGAFLLLAMGATLGPVLIAAIAARVNQEQPFGFGEMREAERLVAAYRQRLPRHLLFLTIFGPDNGAECGYDPSEVFPDEIDQLTDSVRKQKFNDYAGYYALDQWRNRSRDEEWIAAIRDKIDEQMSRFEVGFLRRCIEATIFSPICMKRVSEFGDSEEIPRFDHNRLTRTIMGEGIEDQIVCTYVDGVAARKKLTLSNWNF